MAGGRGIDEAAEIDVRLTDQTLSCTARARVPKPERHAARLHVRRANARRVTPCGFDFPSRLGRRAEAGPCQLLRRVSRPSHPHGMQPRSVGGFVFKHNLPVLLTVQLGSRDRP